MWQYPAEFFIAHARPDVADDASSTPAPVTIDHRPQEHPSDSLLINLSSAIPAFAGRFARVAEIVVETDRDSARERYRHYRHEGHPLFHHTLEDWER
jgi:DNA polymerase-3 subunit chi